MGFDAVYDNDVSAAANSVISVVLTLYSMIFIACAIGVYGEGGAACLSLVLFFESCIFPTIFTLSIRGLGKDTKRGSSWIVASVCGGALFPAVTGLAADNLRSYHKAMFVPLLGKQESDFLERPI